MEVDLQNVVKLTDFRACSLQETFAHGIFEQDCTSRSLCHTKEMRESGILILLSLIDINQSTTESRGTNDRDREGG